MYLDVAERLSKDYHMDDTQEGINSIREMLSLPGVHFFVSPQDVLWVYLLISDEAIELLRSKTSVDEFTSQLTSQLLTMPGRHIYIFRSLAPENVSQRQAFREAAQILIRKHRAIDISWHDDKRVYLHTFKG